MDTTPLHNYSKNHLPSLPSLILLLSLNLFLCQKTCISLKEVDPMKLAQKATVNPYFTNYSEINFETKQLSTTLLSL